MVNESSETTDVKEISQAAKIKDLYFDLLKSSKKEIMLIFPTNKAFERHRANRNNWFSKASCKRKKPQSQSVSACRKFRK